MTAADPVHPHLGPTEDDIDPAVAGPPPAPPPDPFLLARSSGSDVSADGPRTDTQTTPPPPAGAPGAHSVTTPLATSASLMAPAAPAPPTTSVASPPPPGSPPAPAAGGAAASEPLPVAGGAAIPDQVPVSKGGGADPAAGAAAGGAAIPDQAESGAAGAAILAASSPAAFDRLWQPQTLIPVPKAVPHAGWRKAVYRVSAGTVNPGPSSTEATRDGLREGVTRPLAARRGERIAVLSTKGGVGKTTTTLMLGHTLAIERGDRVVALDANPDYGTLGYRVSTDTQRTVRDLLDARGGIRSYPDVRAYTTQAPSRLEVLAGDADPAVSEAYTAQDYADSLAILGQHYNVVLTDCGTGVLHDAMRAVLHMATQLVIVTGPAVDQARHADHLLRWLHRHGAEHHVGVAVTVVNAARNDLAVDVEGMVAHFEGITRAVVKIPYDPVLAAGGIDGLDRLDRDTQDAYLALAAEVCAGFGRDGI